MSYEKSSRPRARSLASRRTSVAGEDAVAVPIVLAERFVAALPLGAGHDAVVVAVHFLKANRWRRACPGILTCTNCQMRARPLMVYGPSWLTSPAQGRNVTRSYQLLALDALEDVAGNQIGRAFEVDNFDTVDKSPNPKSILIPFRVASPGTD